MSLYKFEDFTTQMISNTPNLTPSTHFEENNVETFEQGYKAGWDDAAAAQQGENSQISTIFARNLQELSFTYHEARGQVLTSIEPLLMELVTKILPRIAIDRVPKMIVAEIIDVAKTESDATFEIVISPHNQLILEGLITAHEDLDVSIITEPSMADGLAYIRFGENEKQIDLDNMFDRFSTAIEQFFNQQGKDNSNE